MAARTESLNYGRNDKLPLPSLALLAVQHAALGMVYLVNAVVIARAAGLSQDQLGLFLSATLVGCGIGAALQGGSVRFASGLLIVPIASPNLIIPLSQAGMVGGAGAIATLVIMGGVIQIMMAPVIFRLRAFFTSEVCGVVILMLGVSLIHPATTRLVGFTNEDPYGRIDPTAVLVGGLTLLTIVVSSGWLKGFWRFFFLLLGCGVGYTATLALGGHSAFQLTAEHAFDLNLPSLTGLSWPDATTVPVVVLLAMISSVYSMGVIINTDRLGDTEWSKPDLGMVARGVSVMGLSNVITGLLGGTYLGMSTMSNGLAFATGVTSRFVGFAAGLILIAASFSSSLVSIVMAIPEPVLGGVLLFMAGYFIVAGSQLALTRAMSPRRMIVIGLPVAIGISVVAVPGLTGQLTGPAATMAKSPYIVGALLVLVLNAAARIGIKQTKSVQLVPGDDWFKQTTDIIDSVGGSWGLPKTTVQRVMATLHEAVFLVESHAKGPVSLDVIYDDLDVELRFTYAGSQISFPLTRPTTEEMLNDPDAVRRMSAWLIKGLSSRCSIFKTTDLHGLAIRFET